MSLTPDDARVFALCKSIESVLIGHNLGEALSALLATTRAILQQEIQAQPDTPPPDSIVALLLVINNVCAALSEARDNSDETRH